jgi:hypothetical protein
MQYIYGALTIDEECNNLIVIDVVRAIGTRAVATHLKGRTEHITHLNEALGGRERDFSILC